MEQAEGRVRASLLLGELAQQNNIRVDPAKVREAIETAASTYEQPAEVVQLYYNNQHGCCSRWKARYWKNKWLTGCWKTLK